MLSEQKDVSLSPRALRTVFSTVGKRAAFTTTGGDVPKVFRELFRAAKCSLAQTESSQIAPTNFQYLYSKCPLTIVASPHFFFFFIILMPKRHNLAWPILLPLIWLLLIFLAPFINWAGRLLYCSKTNTDFVVRQFGV